ncbi:glutaredoxin family protein [Reinekea forsetii]|nr:glutaredoxin family protein [Reinekea forsetii]
MNLFLYHTAGCHLCELAEQELSKLPLKDTVALVLVDIADSEPLMKQYDVRIPVIKLESVDSDLGWPFSCEDVVHYLAQNKIEL